MIEVKKIIFAFLLIFNFSSAITIDCNFRTLSLTIQSGYGCDGKATTDGSSQISSITGNHQTEKSNNDTEVFRIWNDCTLELIPQNIAKFFPNLIGLWFNDCKFKEVEAVDFMNMTNLVELDLGYNQMKFVHEKAFAGLRSLQFLYLNNNRIIFVGPNVVQTLPSLVYVTLEDNSCISANSFNFEDSDVRNFIIDVAIQCPLTMKIAENLLDGRKIVESRKYIKDLREVIDNAMMVDDDNEEDDEIRFDDYRSSEPNDVSLEGNEVKGSLESAGDENSIRNQTFREILPSVTNKNQEDMKAAVKNVVLKKLKL